MQDLVLIADDLTGAADTAAPFAARHIPTRLLLDHVRAIAGGVTAISTESRELDLAAARDAVRLACQRIKRVDLEKPILFKKIDSTLRGHVVDELRIFVEEFNVERLLLSPAFPSQDRTTIGGRVHVRGVPFDQSDFRGPDHGGDLIRLFDDVGGLPVHYHSIDYVRGNPECLQKRLGMPGIHVPDVEISEDLTRVARAALASGIISYCGAGGLGRALAKCLSCPSPPQDVPALSVGPFLIVAGSLNPATIDQVHALRKSGVAVLDITGEEASVRATVELLGSSRDAVLSSHPTFGQAADPEQIRIAIARSVESIVAGSRPGTLVLTGGDIAAAVCQELRVEAITLDGEVEPGIPLGRLDGGPASGLAVITKAGGFGDRETLTRLIESTRRH